MTAITKQITTRLLPAAIIFAAAAQYAQAQNAPPASVDRTTPRTQVGLTLLAVTRGDAQGQYTFPIPANMDFLTGPRGNGPAGGIGLWVRGPKPPPPTVQKRNGVRVFVSPPFFQMPSASSMALNGDAVPMQVEPVSSFSSDPRGGQPAPLYLVTLPGGYPNGYPAIDVTMFGAQGHAAHWRLIRLTAPYHAIVPPVAARSSFSGAGVTLGVHAWRDTGYVPISPSASRYDPMATGIHYEVAAKMPAGSRWVVRIFKRQLEWEAVRPAEIAALQARNGPQYAHFMQRQPLWTAAFGPAPQPPMQDMIPTPYGKYNRYLRLSGVLVQMASVSENVTFHNLNIRRSVPPPQFGGPRGYTPPPSYEIGTRPQSAVTPSGISITLLPLPAPGQGNRQYFGYSGPDTIRLLLRFGQPPPQPGPFQQASLVLPKSPLYKKYHKPETYFLQVQKPYYLEPFYGGFPQQGRGAPTEMLANLRLPFTPPVRTVQNGRVTFRMAPSVVPKHLNSLTFSVVQQAELRSIPISFTVPINAQAPVRQAPGSPRRFVR